MNPVFNWIGTSVNNIVGTLTQVAKSGMKYISLTPYYVQHLLWLIDDKFKALAQKGYGGNAAVYACIRVLSTSVPEPPLIPYIRQPDGNPGDPLEWGHPLRGLIRQPNPMMTEFDFWELTTIHCAIQGRSFWFKERDRVGNILNLWPLRPDRVGPIYARPDDDETVVLGWSYLVPGTTRYVPIPRADVLHFHFPDPMGESGGMAEGFGPLQALISEVSADNEATQFVGNLVHNYATPGVVIEVQGKITSQDDATLIKESFARDFGGSRRGKPAVIDSGSKITQVGFSLQQLEFKDLRKVTESRVAAAFGVPAILAGLLVGLDASSTNATVDILRAFFAETTLATYWRRFSDRYSSDVASEFGDDIICAFDLTKVRALAQQAVQTLDRLMLAYQNEALTKNEIREVLGFEKRFDGDAYISGIGSGRGVGAPVEALPVDHSLDPEKAEAHGLSQQNRPSTDNPQALDKPGGTVVTAPAPAARFYIMAGGRESMLRSVSQTNRTRATELEQTIGEEQDKLLAEYDKKLQERLKSRKKARNEEPVLPKAGSNGA